MYSRRLLTEAVLVLVAAIVLFLGIVWLDPFPGLESPPFGPEEEERLGTLVISTYLELQDTLPLSEFAHKLDPVTSRLTSVMPDKGQSLTFHVVEDPAVNAFAIFGGHIVLFSGLIDHIETHEELAAVIAHEIGHIEQHHMTKLMVRSLGIGILASAMGGDRHAILDLTVNLTTNAFSRSYEKEADAYALKLLEKAGIDPSCLADFFLRARPGSGQSIPEFFSTHPSDQSRIDQARNYRVGDNFTEVPL
jgi:predicted Zn-dependent protease